MTAGQGQAPGIGILTEEFGAYSTVFVQRQIDVLGDRVSFVGCWLRSNAQVFDFEPVHVLRWSGLRRRMLHAVLRPLPSRYAVPQRLEACSELARCLDRYEPDLLHVHFGWAAVRVLPLLRRRNIPFTLVLHGSDLNTAAQHPRSTYARRLVQAMKRARHCFLVSEDLRGKALALGCPPERASVFYLGVPVPREAADPGAGDVVRILSNGRLVECKGHAHLLDAFAELTRSGLPVELSIIGEGPLRAELERRCQELGIPGRVRFVDRLSNADVYRELGRSHVFVHPSVRLPNGQEEGLGLVVQEAMAVGLPVVCTRTGGVPESVEDGTCGLLVPPGDPGKLAGALEQLVGDPDLRRRMGAAGRRRVQERFDLERQNETLRRVLEEMVQPQGSKSGVGPAISPPARLDRDAD